MVPHLDPTGELHGGLPTWPWGAAPEGFMTRRQLTAAGLRPGGQQPAGQIKRGRRLFAYLYRVDLAKPKRTASPAWLAATKTATQARRFCWHCETHKPYVIPKRWGFRCLDCLALAESSIRGPAQSVTVPPVTTVTTVGSLAAVS